MRLRASPCPRRARDMVNTRPTFAVRAYEPQFPFTIRR